MTQTSKGPVSKQDRGTGYPEPLEVSYLELGGLWVRRLGSMLAGQVPSG